MAIFNHFSIEPKYAEKRDFVRMQINTPVLFTLTDTDTTFSGMCKNLSGNGLLFETTTKIDIFNKLKISIHSPNKEFNQLCAIIQVVRINNNHSTNGVFTVGAKILHLEP